MIRKFDKKMWESQEGRESLLIRYRAGFPQILSAPAQQGLMGRIQKKGGFKIKIRIPSTDTVFDTPVQDFILLLEQEGVQDSKDCN